MRRAWHELPPELRAEVERRLGARVEGVRPTAGGFSWGVLGVASLEGGGQVFVKAVPSDEPVAADYRVETAVAPLLPPSTPTPVLLFSVEAWGWVLLCFEVVPGRLPHQPWRVAELDAIVAAMARSAAPAGGLPSVADRMAGRCVTWRAIRRDGAFGEVELGPWERAHLERLAEVESCWESLVTGTSLLHFDPRFDNYLIDVDGSAWILDWGRACAGPAWVDQVCLLLQSDLGGLDPAELFGRWAAGAEAERVDAFLVALAGYWTHTATLAGPPHAPHLRWRRESSRRSTMEWLRQRWGG
ncbi:phosphotransferase [Nonomuraea sp. NPDC049152]|uniref:phosphotransferase n=1 Tax=Nonomuraea sp. NPDC049152 TaxID=3154350 RepID=UPI0033D3DA4A